MPKVLIVSTRDLTPQLGGTILWSPQVERLVASSPAAAFEVTRSLVPSLVVLDGTEAGDLRGLVQLLRESPGTRRSSVVVFDAAAAVSEEDLLGAGANLVLSGPVDPAQWNEGLRKLMFVPRRVRTGLTARFEPSGNQDHSAESVVGLALDVSIGGMLLEAPAAPTPGRTLDLFLTLPDGGEELRATGRAVWVSIGPPIRAGIQFLRLEGAGPERIRRLLTSVPDRTFGRYEVLDLIGEGSMGRVYRGFDPLARRAVAIKTPKPAHLDGAESTEFLRRFRREAQAAARLVHPNVITIYDIGDDYFVMELLSGTTLQTVLRQRGRLEPEEVRGLLGPVAEAIDHAHGAGTIHRDIKPGNIMVLSDGRPKLMDFGVAHLSSAVITGSGQSLGSPAYMAPEQIRNGEATPATDLFSLAVVAYEALTGRKPFEGDGVTPILYHVLNSEPPPPSGLNPALPSAYDELFRRALAKDPAARFESAMAFVAALATDRTTETLQFRMPESPVSAPPNQEMETVDLKDAGARPFLRRAHVRLASLAAALIIAVGGAITWSRAAGPKALPALPGLQISTVPAGAAVLLDGHSIGKSPLFLADLPEGVHSIRIVQEGFAPAELAIETALVGPPVPLRFTLQPLTASLRIDSDPSASLEIDGRPAGTAPVTGLTVSPGIHRVALKRPGFQPWLRTIDAKPGETLRLEARLETSVRRGSPDEAQLFENWVRVGDLVELGPGVTPPLKIAGAPASYPDAARRLRLRGSVTVEMLVTERGDVADARVVESAGELLDDSLLSVVRDWRYEAARANGVKVRVRIRTRQTFG